MTLNLFLSLYVRLTVIIMAIIHCLRLHSGSLDVHTIEELKLEKITKIQSNCQPPITMHTNPCHLVQKVCLLNSIRNNKCLLVLQLHSRSLILMLLYFGKIPPIPATSVI